MYSTSTASEKIKILFKQEKTYWMRMEATNGQNASGKTGLQKFFPLLCLTHNLEGQSELIKH